MDNANRARIWQETGNKSREIVDGVLVDPSNPMGERVGGLKAKTEMVKKQTRDKLKFRTKTIAEYEQGVAEVECIERLTCCCGMCVRPVTVELGRTIKQNMQSQRHKSSKLTYLAISASTLECSTELC